MTSPNGHAGHVTVEGVIESRNDKGVTVCVTLPPISDTHVRALPAMTPIVRKIVLSRLKLVDKFWSHVDRGEPTSCWPWTGQRNAGGYGTYGWQNVARNAHRIAWILTHGPIQEGVVVRHLVCDNRVCCNPAHLALGTHADNAADRVAKGRSSHHSSPQKRGAENPSAKLTNASVAEIRALLAIGVQQKVIAKEFAVSNSTINLIAKGKTWTSIQ